MFDDDDDDDGGVYDSAGFVEKEQQQQHQVEKCNHIALIAEKIRARRVELTERLKNCCCICLLEENKNILLSCCNQVVCNMCVDTWSKKSCSITNCPYCRTPLNDFLSNISLDSALTIGDKKHEYHKLCTRLYTENNVSKTAIIYCLNRSTLSDNYLITYNHLIIDGAFNAKIAKFRNDTSLRFCFINSALCNYGFNMSFVDNVIFLNKSISQQDEKQIIGRFQRYPRNTQLKIFFLNN